MFRAQDDDCTGAPTHHLSSCTTAASAHQAPHSTQQSPSQRLERQQCLQMRYIARTRSSSSELISARPPSRLPRSSSSELLHHRHRCSLRICSLRKCSSSSELLHHRRSIRKCSSIRKCEDFTNVNVACKYATMRG